MPDAAAYSQLMSYSDVSMPLAMTELSVEVLDYSLDQFDSQTAPETHHPPHSARWPSFAAR